MNRSQLGDRTAFPDHNEMLAGFDPVEKRSRVLLKLLDADGAHSLSLANPTRSDIEFNPVALGRCRQMPYHDLTVAGDIEILSEITSVETIAAGGSVRIWRRLDRAYGPGKWRKCKGVARVRLVDGFIGIAEIHWYEAHGRGRVDVKIKRMLSERP